MNGLNVSFVLIKVFGMCNNIVYVIKSFIDIMILMICGLIWEKIFVKFIKM